MPFIPSDGKHQRRNSCSFSFWLRVILMLNFVSEIRSQMDSGKIENSKQYTCAEIMAGSIVKREECLQVELIRYIAF